MQRGQLPYLRVSQGWQKISADFYINASTSQLDTARYYALTAPPLPAASGHRCYFSSTGFSDVDVVVQLETPYVEFLMDHASLVVLETDPDWKQAANQRIEDIRKNSITVK